MKTILLSVFSLLLMMMLSFSSFADKILIIGEPVVLEKQGTVYHLPSGHVSTTAYHYVTIDGRHRVCYLEPQPTLASLDVLTINVDVDGAVTTWNCYEYNTADFAVTP